MIPNFMEKKLIINLKKNLFISIILLLIFNHANSDEIYNKGKKISKCNLLGQKQA